MTIQRALLISLLAVTPWLAVGCGTAELGETIGVSGGDSQRNPYITDGQVQRGCGMRITRDGIIIHDGKVNTLRRFQEDVREVRDGYECGLTVERFQDIQESDEFEFCTTQSVARSL